MSEPVTLRCGLPLLQPAQAQKHVTVNDAMMRLDALVNLVLNSVTVATPPAVVVDGQCWAVPPGATAAWEGHGGEIAIGANGGWVFAIPQRGQRGFVLDRGVQALWNGSAWIEGGLTLGGFGSGMVSGVTEGEAEITPGKGVISSVLIPANTLVIGVTSRVIRPITGTLTSWQIGVVGALNRFGSGLGLAGNSWSQGLLSAPMAVYTDQALRLTPLGGEFASGRVRLAIHWLALRVPDPV